MEVLKATNQNRVDTLEALQMGVGYVQDARVWVGRPSSEYSDP